MVRQQSIVMEPRARTSAAQAVRTSIKERFPTEKSRLFVGIIRVTHVFVDDPTQGYGLYIEWMLSTAQLMEDAA